MSAVSGERRDNMPTGYADEHRYEDAVFQDAILGHYA